MTLAEAPLRGRVVLRHVGGERAFRRRLMEMGLVPGTEVSLINVAPLGDPLELHVRGSRLSIRAAEANLVTVEALGSSAGAA